MLELRDVHTYYGESHILHGVSLEVKEGTVVALLGRNGMGKTTTIRSIMGFTPACQGVIRFKGVDITHRRRHEIARLGIGLVPQGRRIFPSLSVSENLKLAARGSDRPDSWTLERVYSSFPVLKERAKLKGNLLSGGEQQMLTFCRALMTNPDLLLMDEPSEGLAPAIVQTVGRTIAMFKENGLSILLVEQNLGLALSVADHVYIMNKGMIVHECTPEGLQANEEIRNKYLGASR